MNSDLENLGERIAELAAHLDAATHRLLTDLREFDARGGWHTQGAMSCAHWLAWRVGWDLVTARERVRVARKLADFPAIDDALRRGQLSYSKVRALLRIATPANEAMVLEQARLTTAAQLEKLTRKYALVQRHGQDRRPGDDEPRRYVRRRDTDDGMVKIEAVLHPEEAELVWTMLDHATKQLVRERPEPVVGGGQDALEGAAGCPTRDSAKSRVATVGPGSAEAAPVHPHVEAPVPVQATDVAVGSRAPSDDSAESGVAIVGPGSAEAAPVHPHVEAPVPVQATDVGVGSRAPSDDSAESASERSLLDRLLDEAEAARAHDGMHHVGDVVPSPVTASPIEVSAAAEPGMLRRQADATRRAFQRADALLSIAQAYLRGDRPQRAPIDVTVTIPAASLRKDAVDTVDAGCIGDSCISAATARRLSCDAGVIEVVEDEHGVPLSVGRKRRTIAGSIKRALLRRDTTCSYPGCTNRTFLEGHHIEHWADGGATTLDNAALLCSHHHRYVHEYGYVIELGPDRRPQFRDPRGRLVAAVPACPAGPDLGWPQIYAMNEPLAIDAATIACEWDGSRADYGRLVSELVAVDGLS